MKRIELLISGRSFSGKLPATITPALTLVACIWKVPGSNIGWHTHDLGSLYAFPLSSEASARIANPIYKCRERFFANSFQFIHSFI
jgi:hypothetical protein